MVHFGAGYVSVVNLPFVFIVLSEMNPYCPGLLCLIHPYLTLESHRPTQPATAQFVHPQSNLAAMQTPSLISEYCSAGNHSHRVTPLYSLAAWHTCIRVRINS